MYADKRSTNINPQEYACNDCGSKGHSSKEETTKITLLGKDEDFERRLIDGRKAVFMGTSGSSNMTSFLKAIWTTGSDLTYIVAAFNAVNMEKTTIPDGQALIVTEHHEVYRFTVSPRKKLMSLREVAQKDLPVAIGSGASYFQTYRETFKIGWLDAFRLAIHRDKHSSTDQYSVAGWSPDKGTGELKLKMRERVRPSRSYEELLKIAQRNMRLS
jgi:hypothetical protein